MRRYDRNDNVFGQRINKSTASESLIQQHCAIKSVTSCVTHWLLLWFGVMKADMSLRRIRALISTCWRGAGFSACLLLRPELTDIQRVNVVSKPISTSTPECQEIKTFHWRCFCSKSSAVEVCDVWCFWSLKTQGEDEVNGSISFTFMRSLDLCVTLGVESGLIMTLRLTVAEAVCI